MYSEIEYEEELYSCNEENYYYGNEETEVVEEYEKPVGENVVSSYQEVNTEAEVEIQVAVLTYKVTTNSMSLRYGPGGAYGIMRTLQPGTIVAVIDEVYGDAQIGHRFQVEVDGQIGWISAGSVVSINDPAANEAIRFTINSMSLRAGPGAAHVVVRTL
ncbi:MAG: SH3 domain-containing protein, partial [Oscillospiraceae bacterium]|nr:SH3 domain-containing protein [Oscillospiraceae bacterium]